MNSSDTTDRLQKALQASLRPVDPGAEFTAALQARLLSAEQRSSGGPRPLPSDVISTGSISQDRIQRMYPACLALAATIVVALAVSWQLQEQRAEQAHVHTQVLLALEITGETLGLAQQRIEQYQLKETRP